MSHNSLAGNWEIKLEIWSQYMQRRAFSSYIGVSFNYNFLLAVRFGFTLQWAMILDCTKYSNKPGESLSINNACMYLPSSTDFSIKYTTERQRCHFCLDRNRFHSCIAFGKEKLDLWTWLIILCNFRNSVNGL